jgi:TonB family protein
VEAAAVIKWALAVLLVVAPQEAPQAEGPGQSATTESGAKITPPTKLRNVSPEWPDRARRVGLNGPVVLECRISPAGEVQNVTIVRGYKILAEAAAKAVAKWRYTPTVVDGVPREVIMTVTVNFALQVQPRRDDLYGGLKDEDPEVRWAATRWLGRYRPLDKKQRRALESARNDASPLVREEAEQQLARMNAEE